MKPNLFLLLFLILISSDCYAEKYNCCYWSDYECGGGGEYSPGKCENSIGGGSALICLADMETGENYVTKKSVECYIFRGYSVDKPYQPYPVKFAKENDMKCKNVEVECKWNEEGALVL